MHFKTPEKSTVWRSPNGVFQGYIINGLSLGHQYQKSGGPIPGISADHLTERTMALYRAQHPPIVH